MTFDQMGERLRLETIAAALRDFAKEERERCECHRDPDAETGTADDRITAEQIAVLRKYLDNMEKRHLRDAAKELEGVSVNNLLGRVFPVDVSAMVDEPMFQGWLEVRRRLERLDQLDAPIKGLLAGLPCELPLGVCLQNLATERDQLQARLAKCDAALRLAQYYMRLPPEPTSSDHEKYDAALDEVSAALKGR